MTGFISGFSRFTRFLGGVQQGSLVPLILKVVVGYQGRSPNFLICWSPRAKCPNTMNNNGFVLTLFLNGVLKFFPLVTKYLQKQEKFGDSYIISQDNFQFYV